VPQEGAPPGDGHRGSLEARRSSAIADAEPAAPPAIDMPPAPSPFQVPTRVSAGVLPRVRAPAG